MTRGAYESLALVSFAIRRRQVNEWKRQETAVLLNGVEVKSCWLPMEWTDGQMAANLLFGVTPRADS